MELINLLPIVYAKFIMFILAFARISAFCATFILFRHDMISTRIVISLSALLSIYVLLLYPNTQINYELLSFQMVVQVLFQSLVGFLGGIILNIMFEIFSAAGQLISMQIGLGMASLFDPRLGNVTALTHFYFFSIMLIFLLMNGHLLVFQTLLDGFSTLSLDQAFMPVKLFKKIMDYSSVIFADSLLLSVTVIVAILITNLALAVLTKFAPQFNIFSIGINLSLIIGLVCVYITFNLFLTKSEEIIKEGVGFYQHAVLKMKHYGK